MKRSLSDDGHSGVARRSDAIRVKKLASRTPFAPMGLVPPEHARAGGAQECPLCVCVRASACVLRGTGLEDCAKVPPAPRGSQCSYSERKGRTGEEGGGGGEGRQKPARARGAGRTHAGARRGERPRGATLPLPPLPPIPPSPPPRVKQPATTPRAPRQARLLRRGSSSARPPRAAEGSIPRSRDPEIPRSLDPEMRSVRRERANGAQSERPPAACSVCGLARRAGGRPSRGRGEAAVPIREQERGVGAFRGRGGVLVETPRLSCDGPPEHGLSVRRWLGSPPLGSLASVGSAVSDTARQTRRPHASKRGCERRHPTREAAPAARRDRSVGDGAGVALSPTPPRRSTSVGAPRHPRRRSPTPPPSRRTRPPAAPCRRCARAWARSRRWLAAAS